MRRPVIGIAGTYEQAPASSAFPTLRRIFTNEGYTTCLQQAGALVILLSPTTANLEQLIQLCDGVLFAGGADIDPSFYKQERTPLCGPSDLDADAFHLALYHQGRQAQKPILGICRGMQLINVAEGGTLHQDYKKREGGAVHHPDLEHWNRVSHQVTIERDSVLFSLLKKPELGVNSLHHQLVHTPSDALNVTALASDGSIEAFEAIDGPWCVGVQWHPETLGKAMAPLFEAFVREASLRRPSQS